MERRPTVSLICCERSGKWAAAWRIVSGRRARGAESRADIRLIETRSPIECIEAIRAAPSAFVLLELTASDCDRALELLLEISTRRRDVAAAVVAERSLKAYEWLARELGAVHFVVSPRELPPLVGMVERFAERFAARQPPPELELEESVWASLPWARR